MRVERIVVCQATAYAIVFRRWRWWMVYLNRLTAVWRWWHREVYWVDEAWLARSYPAYSRPLE